MNKVKVILVGLGNAGCGYYQPDNNSYPRTHLAAILQNKALVAELNPFFPGKRGL